MIPGGRLLLVNRRVSEIRATDWRVKGRREGGRNELDLISREGRETPTKRGRLSLEDE